MATPKLADTAGSEKSKVQHGSAIPHGGDTVSYTHFEHPFIPYFAHDIGEEEIEAVVECLKSGWLTTGPYTRKLENEVASRVNARYALGVNSCTAALHLALNVIGVSEGDEVITTPMTFCSTVAAPDLTRCRVSVNFCWGRLCSLMRSSMLAWVGSRSVPIALQILNLAGLRSSITS